MAYLIFSLSLLLVYAGLALALHIQFGLLGIPNFGVVGFWGLGMYTMGVFQVQYELSFVDAIGLTMVAILAVSAVFAATISRMERQAIVCATLAFGAIVALLVVTEKWLTEGVVGLGTIRYPVRVGGLTEPFYFLTLVALVILLQVFVFRLHRSAAGRLLIAVRDNEELAASLGKDTGRIKFVWFTLSAAIMGFLGAMSAPLNQFLTPNMIVPSVTFAVWIALVLGGKESSLGAILGVFLTFGLFDILIETYLPVSPELAVIVPNAKLFCYGLLLVGVLLYLPTGVLRRDGEAESRVAGFLDRAGNVITNRSADAAQRVPTASDLWASARGFGQSVVTGQGRSPTKPAATQKRAPEAGAAAAKPARRRDGS